MKKFILFLSFPLFLYSYTINFESALSKTLENNKGLKAKKLEVEKSKLALEEAKGYDYGALVFNENIVRTNHAGYVFGMKLSSREASFAAFGFNEFLAQMPALMGGVPGANEATLAIEPNDLNYPDARTNYETKVTYQVPIFTGFKLDSAKTMAKLQTLAQAAKYTYDEKTLGLEVLKAYNGAVASKEFIKATQKAKEATSSFLEFANELYKEGLVTSIDVKQATVYDMDVDSKMIEAQNRYELALSYLKFLTSDYKITDVSDFKTIENEIAPLEKLHTSALEKRDDLHWMKYNTQTLKSKIDFDSSDNYPTIGAQVEYGHNNDEFNFDNFEDKDYYLGAIGVSYKIFDGGVTSKKAQQSKIAYNQIVNNFEYMKDGIKLEIEKNFLTLKTKEKVLDQKIKAQSLSDEVLEQSSEMYKNHLINMSNLLMQQANQQKASAQTIMAKYEKSLAAAKLKISLGESLK